MQNSVLGRIAPAADNMWYADGGELGVHAPPLKGGVAGPRD